MIIVVIVSVANKVLSLSTHMTVLGNEENVRLSLRHDGFIGSLATENNNRLC